MAAALLANMLLPPAKGRGRLPDHQATRRDQVLPDLPREITMKIVVIVVVAVIVLFRLGRVRGPRNPGFRLIVPFIDVLHRVSLRIVTMPIQSQGIITRDNVSVDVSAVVGQHSLDQTLSETDTINLDLQSLVEIGVDKNTTVVFPAPLMTTIAELGSFLARERAAASPLPLTVAGPLQPPAVNGSAAS
jgi:hypothetical protein